MGLCIRRFRDALSGPSGELSALRGEPQDVGLLRAMAARCFMVGLCGFIVSHPDNARVPGSVAS
jgi:hypothetical protein